MDTKDKKIILKFISLLLFVIFTTSQAHAFLWFKSKDKEKQQEKMPTEGFKGTLPDLNKDFNYKHKKNSVNTNYDRLDTNIKEKDLIEIPRENKLYLEVIIKKDKTSDYVNDINDLIPLLEKIKVNLYSIPNVQIFNSQMASLVNNVNYIEAKYANKPVLNTPSFKCLKNAAETGRSIALLYAESTVYKKYLSYDGEGAIYKQSNINALIENYAGDINNTLYAIRSQR